MKMETVIRSPQDGVIKKLAHKEGVSISHPLSGFMSSS
jgi:biotin carboxyl carrier protein